MPLPRSPQPLARRTLSICDAVSPSAPARAIARAVAMLVGDMTTPLSSSLAFGSRSSRWYRASPNALMSAAVRLASAVFTGARSTEDFATASPASGAAETATHGVPSWSAIATQPSATPPSSVTSTGAT